MTRTEPERQQQLSAEEFTRRRRGRNYALLAVLVALSLLFYAITIVQKGG